MSAQLPSLSRTEFERQLARCSPEPLGPASVDALYAHYQEMRLWNRRLSLVGPGTAEEVVGRHYGEALAALPLIPPDARQGLDIGSGAGFPGIVLAAARPGLEMTLVEPRERKWSFLLAAARKASLPCQVLNARVHLPLPAGLPERLDLVTIRALRLDLDVLGVLARRLTPEGQFLLWVGEKDPELPPELEPAGSVPLAGSERRRILRLRCPPAGPETL
ncbi:MAG TPA: RsmG family class I SAM-dependent methyltransferase [Thermoanaerobaculia bacterium]|nr:RsmG family class I SAM-dependent methyltransferase [Thermoanaerobaculia bacterium]